MCFCKIYYLVGMRYVIPLTFKKMRETPKMVPFAEETLVEAFGLAASYL